MTNMHGHWVWFKLSSLHICHWPPYKELQKSLGLGTCVIDQSQWQICIEHRVWFRLSSLHICHWPPYKELQKSLGLGIIVIDHSQWQMCVITEFDSDSVSAYLSLTKVNDKYASNPVFDLNSLACIFVIDQIPKRHCWDLSRHTLLCIFVIDHSQWQICIQIGVI